jgi:hypothetical protein
VTVTRYLCPLCKSPLTKSTYEAVLKIQESRDRATQAQLARAHAEAHRQRAARAALSAKLKAARTQAKEARAEGVRQGRGESQRQVTELRKKLQQAERRARRLQRGTTAQSEGLEFEEQLAARLRREFRGDRVTLVRRGGDVVHEVVYAKQSAGRIVYECKREEDIAPAHVRQAARAKGTREAEFAILVTTGERKGFTGLAAERGVLIVRPQGVLALAALCRGHLVEMAKAGVDRSRRAQIAQALLAYLTSSTYRVPLEEAIQQADRAEDVLRREVQLHLSQWEERSRIYQTIRWDVSHIRDNVARVKEGAKPVPLERVRVQRLLLPKPAAAS